MAQILNKKGLNVAARPVDNMVQPYQAPRNTGLDQLAGALRSVSPAIAKFSAERDAKQKAASTEAAEARIGKLSFQEAQKMRKEGTLAEQDDEWYMAALDQAYGRRQAEASKDALGQAMQGLGDDPLDLMKMSRDDVDAWISQKVGADMEGLGDGAASGAYMKAMDQTRQQLLDYTDKVHAGEWKRQAQDAAAMGLREAFDVGSQEGKSPTEIVVSMRSQFAANEALYRLTPAEQEEAMVGVADSLAAEGNTAMVREILTGKRTLANGQSIGPIGNTKAYASKAAAIMKKAEATEKKDRQEHAMDTRINYKEAANSGQMDEAEFRAYNKANPGVFSQAEQESIIIRNNKEVDNARATLAVSSQFQEQELAKQDYYNQMIAAGRGQEVGDKTVINAAGKQVKLSAKEQREAMVTSILSQPMREGETPEQHTRKIVYDLSRNGFKHPTWGNTMKNGMYATTQMQAQKGEIAQATKDGYTLYNEIKRVNPKYLSGMMDPDTRAFYRMVDTATNLGGEDPSAAIATVVAAQATMNTPEGIAKQRIQKEQLETAVNKLQDKPWWFTGKSSNVGLAPKVMSLSEYYIEKGMSAEDAVQAATDHLGETHEDVNGVQMDTSMMPQGFKEGVETMVSKFAKKADLDGDDLIARPVNDDKETFIITRKDSMSPLKSEGGSYFLSVGDIMGNLSDVQAREKQDSVDANNKRNEEKKNASIGFWDVITNTLSN